MSVSLRLTSSIGVGRCYGRLMIVDTMAGSRVYWCEIQAVGSERKVANGGVSGSDL